MTVKWRGPGSTSEKLAAEPELVHDSKGELMEISSVGALGTNESARDYVANARSRMGMLARFNFDRQTQKELQRVSGEIAVNYLNAQKQIMIDKIIAGVALYKRQTLEEFLKVAVEQDKELLIITNNAQEEMSRMIDREVMAVLIEKKTKCDEADEQHQKGSLIEGDCKALKDVYEQSAAKLIEDKFDRMAKITDSYLRQFEQALEKYQERAIEYRSIT